MPHRLTRRRERLVIGRAIVDLMRVSSGYREGAQAFGPRADEVLVAYAVLIGTLEGHPLNVSKISDMIGMPRATVRRRLASLVEIGIVHTFTQGRYVVPTPLLMSDSILEMVDDLARILIRAGTELARMASLPIDRAESDS